FSGWHRTILPLARPLTTEARVTGVDAKAALERGRGVVLVCPPAPERAQQLWELLGLTPGRGPGVGPPVVIVCADDAAAAEWPAVAPAGLRVHAVTGLVRSASRLKQRPPQVLAGAVKDLAALVQRAARSRRAGALLRRSTRPATGRRSRRPRRSGREAAHDLDRRCRLRTRGRARRRGLHRAAVARRARGAGAVGRADRLPECSSAAVPALHHKAGALLALGCGRPRTRSRRGA